VTAEPSRADNARALLLELLGIPRIPDDDVRTLARGADWQRVLELAGAALHPMLGYRLGERHVEAPERVRDRLQQARRVSAAKLIRRRAETRRALEALERAAVPVTVLKGFALAHLVYPSPETRLMGDVDLWLHSKTLNPAIAALEPLGWRVPWWRDISASPIGSGGHVGLLLPSASLIVELHLEPGSLVDTVPHALEDFWSRRVQVSLGGVTAWTMPPEETLIHISLHLAQHHRFMDAISRLLDATLVVKAFGPGIDWPAFTNRCAALGISGWVATSLGTAKAMLGAEVPADALAAFRVPDLDYLCAVASEQAWWPFRLGEAPESVLSAPTPLARGARLGRRILELLEETTASPARPRLRPRQLFRRLRVTLQFRLPGFLHTLWLNLARPAEGARLRRLSADNQALVEAMRERSPGTAR
jgi:Uncharacterised nucleotidyltransferase